MQWLHSIANSYGVLKIYFRISRRCHRPKHYHLNCFLWNVLFLCRWQNLVIYNFGIFFLGGMVLDISSSSNQKQKQRSM